MDKAQAFFDTGDWWRRDGAFRLLHDINPLRLRLVSEAAGGTLAGRRLLDMGCGGGIFAEAAALAGARVTGCDISAGAIAAATAHAEAGGVEVNYRCGGAEFAEAGQYEVLTCFEMLEHAEEPAHIVADASAMLRPGGVAVFSTVNRTAKSWLMMIGGLEYALRLLPAGTHEYSRFITPPELARMVQDCGLTVRRVVGMQYSFFGHTYLLREDEAAVNYFLTAARP